MAIASILHRISGILLFLLLPFVLFVLDRSLHSADTYASIMMLMMHPICKLMLWAFGASLVYHVLAGTRHIIMDLGFGEDLVWGRRSANIVMMISMIATLYIGIRIW
jgi:succinate dehydrogenase / fumarate reductase, cytochrome b subunit